MLFVSYKWYRMLIKSILVEKKFMLHTALHDHTTASDMISFPE